MFKQRGDRQSSDVGEVELGTFASSKLSLASDQSLTLKREGDVLFLAYADSSGIIKSPTSYELVDILEGIGFEFIGDRVMLPARPLKGPESKPLEVEVKAHCPVPIEEMRQRVEGEGGVYETTEKQETIYWQDQSSTIRESGKALRMRIIDDDKAILSYKGEIQDPETRQRVELEIETDENMRKILKRMGFVEDISVVKTRDTFHLEGLEVCLDDVEELGPFIEVESKSPEDKGKIFGLLERLGVSKEHIEKRPYPVLLEEKRAED